MTRKQALIIGVLIGFVILACAGMLVVLQLPYDRLVPPTATVTPLPPTITPSPTRQSFLPTASLETPTPAEPTATNTRVPTSTPQPPRTPTPPVEIKLPTRKPTATTIPSPTPIPLPTNTVTLFTPTVVPLQYDIYFKADDTTITRGNCTDLEWRVVGATVIRLDGQNVSPSGQKEVCPTRNTSYELTVELPGSALLQNRTVNIRVEEKK